MAQVYANAGQDRFFHIPEDANIAPGTLVLRSLSGARLDVDPDAAARFEIDEVEAKALVKEQLGEFTRKAASTMSGIGSFLRKVGQRKPVDVQPSAKSPEVLADTLGVTPEQLRNDPSAVKAGFEDILAGVMASVQDALRDTQESREATRSRLQALSSSMGADAPDPAALEKVLDSLRTTLADPKLEQSIRSASQKLEEATQRIRTEGQAMADELADDAEDSDA